MKHFTNTNHSNWVMWQNFGWLIGYCMYYEVEIKWEWENGLSCNLICINNIKVACHAMIFPLDCFGVGRVRRRWNDENSSCGVGCPSLIFLSSSFFFFPPWFLYNLHFFSRLVKSLLKFIDAKVSLDFPSFY